MKFKNFLISNDALFHFTDRLTLLEKIIPSGNFLLNPMKNTNDPQEYKRYEFDSSTFTATSDLKQIKHIENEINNYFKNYLQIGCFCTYKKNELRNTWLKPKIWSDFGDGHKGICLIFSKKALEYELVNNNLYYGIDNITYNFKPRMLPVPDLNSYKKTSSIEYYRQFVKDNINIIFQKDLDYENENECRCFVISEVDGRIKIDLGTTLKGIIIGDRFPPIYDFILDKFTQKMNIELHKLDFREGIGYSLVKYRGK